MARSSHVDQRSIRYVARQYVSETHDHKPDAPRRLRVEPVVPIDQPQPSDTEVKE